MNNFSIKVVPISDLHLNMTLKDKLYYRVIGGTLQKNSNHT